MKRCLILILIFISRSLYGHGGVYLEEDICFIQMGFLTAHFTIYQPENRGNEEFCESVPEATDSIFVLDYTHDALSNFPIEFQIIKDDMDLGIFARIEDVESLANIDELTVFHEYIEPNGSQSLVIEHNFIDEGWYIGLIRVTNPETNIVYATVFPFEVGSDNSLLFLFILLVLILQFFYFKSQKSANKH
jgi:hypothetical protein